MQMIGTRVVDRERRSAEPLRPGLDVSVVALDAPSGPSAVRLSVRGGTGPVRLYLYVDGELVDTPAPRPESFNVNLVGLGVGRHAVTARAIDAAGRWGGASIVVSSQGGTTLTEGG